MIVVVVVIVTFIAVVVSFVPAAGTAGIALTALWLPVAATADVAGGKRSSDKRSSHGDFPEASDPRRKPRKEAAPTRYKESKRKKRKKRKPLFHKVFEEVADLIEDVFD